MGTTTEVSAIEQFIAQYKPCKEAADWLRENQFQTMDAAWQVCQRSDWMLWLLARVEGYTDLRMWQRMAIAFVRRTPVNDTQTVWDLLTDERSRKAIETAEHYFDDTAALEELEAATGATWAAAAAWTAATWAAEAAEAAEAATRATRATEAATRATEAATRATEAATRATRAAASAWTAAAAAWTAAAAAAWTAAAAAAWTAAAAAQCNIIREFVPHI